MNNNSIDMRTRFLTSGLYRLGIYGAALAVTIVNMIIGNYEAWGGLVITIPITAILYYISGGFAPFMFVVKKITGVIDFILCLMLFFCPFAMGLIWALSTVISFGCCLIGAVIFPIIGVPLVGLVSVHFGVQTAVEDVV